MQMIRNHTAVLSILLSRSFFKLVSYALALLALTLMIALSLFVLSAPRAQAASRIKDIVAVEGIRDNLLVGYGLVVGLNGTGDKLNNITFTQKSLVSFLERIGVKADGETLKTKNVAAVTVTASLPPFARAGSRVDVRVSTMGDATSLQGGTLLASPLLGADGEVYAVAQGAIAIEGFVAGGGTDTGTGSVILKGVPTNGHIPNGGIIEKEVAFDFNTLSQLKLALRNPDISTAGRIAAAINRTIEAEIAIVRDPGTVVMTVPEQFKGAVPQLLAKIEHVTVEPDQVARIVIDEASGTIVMGENVRVDRVALAQGNLVVQITEIPVISQPGAFAPATEGVETVETSVQQVSVTETDHKLTVVNGGATLHELVTGLNTLGIGPRDLISILQTIKAAGAIQADIEAR